MPRQDENLGGEQEERPEGASSLRSLILLALRRPDLLALTVWLAEGKVVRVQAIWTDGTVSTKCEDDFIVDADFEDLDEGDSTGS